MESVNLNDLTFKYEAFGLKIYSEINLQSLIRLESEIADITICYGDVDLNVKNIKKIENSILYIPNIPEDIQNIIKVVEPDIGDKL